MTLPILLLQVAAAVSTGASAVTQLSATRYEFTTVSESEVGGPTPIRATGRITATRSGSLLRYEVTPTPIQFKRDGDANFQTIPVVNPYTLVLDGKRIYSVDTVKQEYFEADINVVAENMSDMVAGLEAFDFEVSDTRFSVTDMGAADSVASHPTTQWRVSGAATLGMSAAGQSVALTMEELTDYYYARDFAMPVIQTMVPDTSAAGGPFAALLGRDYAAKVVREYSKLPNSTPIKTVTRISIAAGMMDMSSSETVELASIATVSVPGSYFEIPRGFKKVDMPVPEVLKPRVPKS